jgi:c-di-GMP-binding flagellar brake protein YcgR
MVSLFARYEHMLCLPVRYVTRNKLILSVMYHCQNPLKLIQFLRTFSYDISGKEVTYSRKIYEKEI